MRKIIKRTIALILAISITPVSYFSQAILPVSANENNKNFVYGDLNNDSSVNVIDMLLLKSHIQEENYSNINISAADVDGDNTLSYKDISELASYLIGTIDIFTAELNIDSDSDGLCDYLEELLQTNPKTKDTDGDGLSDYDEIYLCGTNPTIKDTDSTGKNDNLKDSDKDGISNIDEIKSSTSPNKCDSDDDGLTDYDEIYNYNSDPTNNDTDNDGITDNSEIINGTNPLSSVTENIPDNERIFQKDISQKDSILSDINVSNNLYNCSLSINAAGNIFESLSVRESAYTHFLKNESIIGKIIDISYQENLKFEKLKINFSIDDDNIEKYCIFKYHSDARMILPVETEYNGNEISFTDTECGTYCLVNMDIWISSIAGTQYNTMSEENVGSSPSDPYAPTDIYMLLFLTETNLDIIREELLEASKIILKRYHDHDSDARIYFVNYLGIIPKVDENRYYVEYNDIVNNDDVLSNTIKSCGYKKPLISSDNYLFIKAFYEQISGTYDNSSDDEIKNVQNMFNNTISINSSIALNYRYNLPDEPADSICEIATSKENQNRNKYCIVIDYGLNPVIKGDENKLSKNFDIETIEFINKFKSAYNINLSFIYDGGINNIDYYYQMCTDNNIFIWTGASNSITNINYKSNNKRIPASSCI